MRIKNVCAGAAVATALFAGPLALAATASAEPVPMPPAPPAGPTVASPPAWAPPKPVDPVWANGNPQVWDAGWNHWGVWVDGTFIPTF
ncbi:hypothetical protein [Mycolicibacterium sp. J2]|uniref:hypothetical protein n=1 Tax=Mycolicibacterium sp. J2 TaxID=2993511 RepID=UPI00224B7141|nr:hypothetical protein [Mycolicibacterium sp. J2]MCX2713781.1 hypothetical protein [Mycolicibacterium sp. J2]